MRTQLRAPTYHGAEHQGDARYQVHVRTAATRLHAGHHRPGYGDASCSGSDEATPQYYTPSPYVNVTVSSLLAARPPALARA